VETSSSFACVHICVCCRMWACMCLCAGECGWVLMYVNAHVCVQERVCAHLRVYVCECYVYVLNSEGLTSLASVSRACVCAHTCVHACASWCEHTLNTFTVCFLTTLPEVGCPRNADWVGYRSRPRNRNVLKSQRSYYCAYSCSSRNDADSRIMAPRNKSSRKRINKFGPRKTLTL